MSEETLSDALRVQAGRKVAEALLAVKAARELLKSASVCEPLQTKLTEMAAHLGSMAFELVFEPAPSGEEVRDGD